MHKTLVLHTITLTACALCLCNIIILNIFVHIIQDIVHCIYSSKIIAYMGKLMYTSVAGYTS